MTLQLSEVTEADIHSLSLLQIKSFQSGISHVLTGPPSAENIKEQCEWRLKDMTNPCVKLLKITDTTTGEMIAGAKWNLYPNGNTDAQLDEKFVVPDLEKMGKTQLEPIFRYLVENRKSVMGRRPYYLLSILFTHPDHYRRGAGSMLLQWGLEQADRLGLETYLQASKEGRPLYEKEGFQIVEERQFNMADFGRPDLGVDINFVMIRKPKSPSIAT